MSKVKEKVIVWSLGALRAAGLPTQLVGEPGCSDSRDPAVGGRNDDPDKDRDSLTQVPKTK